MAMTMRRILGRSSREAPHLLEDRALWPQLWHLGTSLIVVVLSTSVDISSALYWECCPLNLSRYFIINFIAACSGACGYLAHKRTVADDTDCGASAAGLLQRASHPIPVSHQRIHSFHQPRSGPLVHACALVTATDDRGHPWRWPLLCACDQATMAHRTPRALT